MSEIDYRDGLVLFGAVEQHLYGLGPSSLDDNAEAAFDYHNAVFGGERWLGVVVDSHTYRLPAAGSTALLDLTAGVRAPHGLP